MRKRVIRRVMMVGWWLGNEKKTVINGKCPANCAQFTWTIWKNIINCHNLLAFSKFNLLNPTIFH